MTRGARRLAVAAAAAVAILSPAHAQEEEEFFKPLVGAGLDRYAIDISTDFAGDDLLLYGAVEVPADIIVVVTGKPPVEVEVRRKDRIAGIWVNRDSRRFANVPTFYGIASSRPLEEILSPAMLARLEIGVERLKLPPQGEIADAADFRRALLRLKRGGGYFNDAIGHVTFGAGGRLFEAHLKFPAVVPPGTVLVSVHIVRDGRIVDGTTLPISVRKSGLGADIFLFAHNHAAAYGAIAIALALLAGWLAHLIFRRS